jgi:hypothetical protein
MRVKLGGRRWSIFSGEDPDDPDLYGVNLPDERIILINPRVANTPKLLLGTIIHECLHPICPFLAEEIVGRAERELTEVLYRLDARVQAPPPQPKKKKKK